jgi:hypothetical protein
LDLEKPRLALTVTRQKRRKAQEVDTELGVLFASAFTQKPHPPHLQRTSEDGMNGSL